MSDSLRSGRDVLDLGCGVGANLARIQAMELPYNSYTGVDISASMLKYAQERYRNLPKVSFVQMDLSSNPLPEGSYDLIVSTWVFEYFRDPLNVANKAWEKLKPGGKMVLLPETRDRSFSTLATSLIYPLIGAHRIGEDEFRHFPGQVVREDHFSRPFGDVTLLVMQKSG